MQGMKIIIVEDEVIIAESLKLMLEKLDYTVVSVFCSGIDFLNNFSAGDADVILMDIHLANNTNGIETCKALAKFSDVPIIYITDSREEKLRRTAIFETNAIHYLNKPFSITDVYTALDLAVKYIEKERVAALQKQGDPYLLGDAVFIKDGTSFKMIKLSDIIYLEADGSYCHVQCRDKKYFLSENMGFFADKLFFAKDLIRVHRSYIINVNYIEQIKESRIFLMGEEIPIGKTYRDALFEKFRFI